MILLFLFSLLSYVEILQCSMAVSDNNCSRVIFRFLVLKVCTRNTFGDVQTLIINATSIPTMEERQAKRKKVHQDNSHFNSVTKRYPIISVAIVQIFILMLTYVVMLYPAFTSCYSHRFGGCQERERDLSRTGTQGNVVVTLIN